MPIVLVLIPILIFGCLSFAIWRNEELVKDMYRPRIHGSSVRFVRVTRMVSLAGAVFATLIGIIVILRLIWPLKT